MSQIAASFGNASIGFCSCPCHKIWGSVNTPICHCQCNKSQYYMPVAGSTEIDQRLAAHDSLIIHAQDGIEKCFVRIEKCDNQIGALTEMYKDIALKVVRFQDYISKKEFKSQESKKEEKDNIFEFRYVYHKGRDDIRHIKNTLYDFYCWILDNIEDNKYRAQGIDLLEAAAMQLNKAISREKGHGKET